MNKRFSALLLVLTISTSVIGCSNKTEEVSSTGPLQTLTIGVMPDVDSLPLIVAAHNEYFQHEGINVKIEHFKSSSDRDSALQAGKIDGAISDMLSVVFFNDNGFDVKITSKTEGSYKLISSKKSNISKIEQSSGKSIGISKNTIIEYLTDRIMLSSNVDSNSSKKIAVPKIPTRLEMLNSGNLDMATLPEPLASLAISSGGKIISSSEKLGINPGVMVFTKDVIDSKSDGIKSFYIAYNKAALYLNKQKPENYIDFVIKEAGFPASVKNILTLPNYSQATMPPEKELIQVLTWLKVKKLTTKNYKLQDLSNDSFTK